MAGKNYHSNPAFRFFTDDARNSMVSDATHFEFDEADLWNSGDTRTEFKKWIPSSRISKKSAKRMENGDRTAASSLPVNIPDWSKILREDYRDSRRRDLDEVDDDDERDGDDGRLPPHEFLAKQFARTQIASFSVHEGVGRTLKGRDLRRVRNAIWEKTGFED
ncbi:protein S40-4-like [Aristolochia californica]|uniref:protein S40-4-like n=1 Tax=Aristolochia californica TaxID=171875 RepID=UPI0035DFABFB